MKKLTKIVKLPDGRPVVFTASYQSGHDLIRPDVIGPLDALVQLAKMNAREFAHGVKHLENPLIEGIGFDGWLGYLFREIGCTVENFDDGGDWVVYVE